jgi:hypothetical protein
MRFSESRMNSVCCCFPPLISPADFRAAFPSKISPLALQQVVDGRDFSKAASFLPP